MKIEADTRVRCIGALIDELNRLEDRVSSGIPEQKRRADKANIDQAGLKAAHEQTEKKFAKAKEAETRSKAEEDDYKSMIAEAKAAQSEHQRVSAILGAITSIFGGTPTDNADKDPATKAINNWQTGLQQAKKAKRESETTLRNIRSDIAEMDEQMAVAKRNGDEAMAICQILKSVRGFLMNVWFGLTTFSQFWKRLGDFLASTESISKLLEEIFIGVLTMTPIDREDMMSEGIHINRWVEARSMWQCLNEVCTSYVDVYTNGQLGQTWLWLTSASGVAPPDIGDIHDRLDKVFAMSGLDKL